MNIMSSTVASSCSAVTGSARISVASGPMMCTPSNLAALFFRHHFDEALVVVEDGGLAVAQERKFADLHVVPASRACRSVSPMEPICGSQ